MGGRDPKNESKKEPGSSSRPKDKGKSSTSGGGRSRKGREKDKERERSTWYNQAYDGQTITVQSSSSRKGKEKSTSGYEASAPAAPSLAPISEWKGTGEQFDQDVPQYAEGNNLLDPPATGSDPTFPSSASETAEIAFSPYYQQGENYSFATPNTENYAVAAEYTLPFSNKPSAFRYETSPNVDALANTLSRTGLDGQEFRNSITDYAPQTRQLIPNGGGYVAESLTNYQTRPSINSGPSYGPRGGIMKARQHTPKQGGTGGRGRGLGATSKGTHWDIQKAGYKKAGNQLADKDLAKHHTRDFKPGKVIRLWWFEPEGDNRGNNGSAASIATDQTAGASLRGRGLPGKMRRFVIVENFDGHSIGIPITTYGFRGCAKPGCHPRDHSIIYTGNTVPSLLRADQTIPRDDEPEIPNPPVKMTSAPNERLFTESRLNYSKKYTIEHNFKVAFIGKIADSSTSTFWQNLDRVRRQYMQQDDRDF